ncbi:hypothetical protein N7474_008827 [Penicillium riverlandense]|uniref:uncharacterized protein n=1 Tax=Penicillium riverlandense TaxID=1903569 RepID=UPI002546A73A|nr:uncharacterized protein N7474_008827 [Penicillium riverlandense]KAJ5812526.1 hypothetical protein N7474_008827 [Penicillium riverlandense]
MEVISDVESAATSIAKDFIPRAVDKAANADDLNVNGGGSGGSGSSGNTIGKRQDIGVALKALADDLGMTLEKLRRPWRR